MVGRSDGVGSRPCPRRVSRMLPPARHCCLCSRVPECDKGRALLSHGERRGQRTAVRRRLGDRERWRWGSQMNRYVFLFVCRLCLKKLHVISYVVKPLHVVSYSDKTAAKTDLWGYLDLFKDLWCEIAVFFSLRRFVLQDTRFFLFV